MTTTIHERISEIVLKLGSGKNTAIASKLGISEGNIRGYIKGVMPKQDVLEKIVINLDVNPEWLLTGKGTMLKNENSPFVDLVRTDPAKGINHIPQTTPIESVSNKPVAVPATHPCEGIPLIPIEAMAGALTSEQTILEYECERYVIPMFKGADFLIPVKGSSMYPKYSSGDIVACQRVPMSDLFFQWNKVYVIDTTQGPLIKRIKPGSDKEHVSIISDNPNYDPFELHLSAIHSVALVIGVLRLE